MSQHTDVLLSTAMQTEAKWSSVIHRHAHELIGHPDGKYVMFRKEDATAWMTFTITFAILIIFDNFVLNGSHQKIGIVRAAVYTLFWMCTALCFAVYIYYRNGHNAAFDWTSGYMLEWMLSFDNLFVFHLIFQIYGTPDHLKHKPLFWGICGAVFFRLLFIFIGEYMMHAMWAAHLFFGAFLVYTGVQSAMVDEDDEDPTQNPLVQWLQRNVPFVGMYDANGSFFVKVPVDKNGEAIIDESDMLSETSSDNVETGETQKTSYGTLDFNVSGANSDARIVRYETRATMLFLVVCCLEISDILFAVDSVSAIVAQVSDLFLAYTSAVFAMLGLRSMFFVIDVLVKLFSLLKYGVAAVLVFIGIKLIISKMVHIPPMLVCFVLFFCLSSSMVASVIKDKWEKAAEEKKMGKGEDEPEEISPGREEKGVEAN